MCANVVVDAIPAVGDEFCSAASTWYHLLPLIYGYVYIWPDYCKQKMRINIRINENGREYDWCCCTRLLWWTRDGLVVAGCVGLTSKLFCFLVVGTLGYVAVVGFVVFAGVVVGFVVVVLVVGFVVAPTIITAACTCLLLIVAGGYVIGC